MAPASSTRSIGFSTKASSSSHQGPATFLGIDLKATGETVAVAPVATYCEHVRQTRSGVVLHAEAVAPPRPLSLAESLRSGFRKS